MSSVMEWCLSAAFFLYLISAILFFAQSLGTKKGKCGQRLALILVILGAVCQIAFTVIRIYIGGHFPTSNLFEFITFLALAVVLAFLVLYSMYRSRILGGFAMLLAVLLLAYAAVFPKEIQPLIPALQSYWLYIHVTTAALGQGAFAIGFVAGLIYLLYDAGKRRGKKSRFWLEIIFVMMTCLLSFSILQFVFETTHYSVQFAHPVQGQSVVEKYTLPPLITPYESQLKQGDSCLLPYALNAPQWVQGEKAATKLNACLWGLLSGGILYGLMRIFLRKKWIDLLSPLAQKINPQLVDEISYRAISIGFPLFTLGALIFAMIWAHEAWGRFWGWDPKETWALVTWLFYSVYLHLRLSRGWHGVRSSWLAVGGFIIIMINLLVINLVLAGLHSYA